MTCLIIKRIKTKDIGAAIDKLALENDCLSSEFSFNLDDTDTYVRSVKDDSFIIYKEDPRGYYADPQRIVNEHVRFKQIYSVTIKQTTVKRVTLDHKIIFSKEDSNAFIVLNPKSRIPYEKYRPKELYMILLKELNNIKALNNILVDIFDKDMKEKLKLFINYLYKGKFVKAVKLPLFTGIEPIIVRNSRLIMRFMQKDMGHQVIEVDEGEALVDYVKPVFGTNGLNAFGEIIDNTYLKNNSDLKCNVDENSIEIVENEEKKVYKSKVKGYVHYDEKDFYVDNKIKMRSLSRVQESVAKEEDNNIEVIISQNDTSLDSLGEGVELTSETIHINGHVGAKSDIKAVNLTIDGATHQNSKQEAKYAVINRHKGKLRCHNAKINLLEGGEVHASDVDIENSIGGTVYAENVKIKNVKSNLKVYASNSIEIRSVSGENNLFKINYRQIPTLKSRYDYLSKDIDDLKYRLERVKRHSPSEVPSIQEKINELKSKQEEITKSVKNAKITIHETFRGLNTITFTLANKEELTYRTDAKKYDPFFLEETKDYIKLHPTAKKISIDR